MWTFPRFKRPYRVSRVWYELNNGVPAVVGTQHLHQQGLFAIIFVINQGLFASFEERELVNYLTV